MKLFMSIFSFFLIVFMKPVTAQPGLFLTPVITNLNTPIQLVNSGDGSNRIFIVQKNGTILVYSKNYDSTGVFLSVTGISNTGEQGLLSMAFHPDFKNNGLFYVYYTNSLGNLEIARFKVSSNPDVANPDSKVILKTIPHTSNTNHNGGELQFGKDSCLYLSTGDGGGAGDIPNNAQNTSVLLGKILRFKVDTTDISPYYSIPASNPFGNEVFAYGLRNPFRWSFDRLNYDMWIGDVGQDSWEEIDYRPSDSILGVNYGWHCYEGYSAYNTSGCNNISTYTFPVYTYPTQNPSAAVTGGTVYRGPTYLDLYGYYIAADFYSGIFYLLKNDPGSKTFAASTQNLSHSGIANFGETEDGELYAVSLTENSVYRIIASGSVNYIFNGDGNWDDPANWSNKTIPPSDLTSGSVITIDPAITGKCILNATQTILSGAKIVVATNKQFQIPGNLNIQ
jgi:glucose/arabinose dehydrogenase